MATDGGVNHCAVKEPAEIVLDDNREVLMPSNASYKDQAQLLGYTRDVLDLLSS